MKCWQNKYIPPDKERKKHMWRLLAPPRESAFFESLPLCAGAERLWAVAQRLTDVVSLRRSHQIQRGIARQGREEAGERHRGRADVAADVAHCGAVLGVDNCAHSTACRAFAWRNTDCLCPCVTDGPAGRVSVQHQVNHPQMRAEAPRHHRRLSTEKAVQDIRPGEGSEVR